MCHVNIALTTCYQGYYECWLRGQYFRKINELHAEYGRYRFEMLIITGIY